MIKQTTISITEARKNIFEITEEAGRGASVFTLTERGKPKVVLMSAEEYESWLETLEVMLEFPNLDDDIKDAEKALREGRCTCLQSSSRQRQKETWKI